MECPKPTIIPQGRPKKLPAYTKIMSMKKGQCKVCAVLETRILHKEKISPRTICVLIRYF